MKYILTYNEQFNKDLLYMMPDLEVKYYVGEKDLCDWDELLNEDWSDTRLIICDIESNKEIYQEAINKYALKEKVHYIWGYEFVKQFDYRLIDSYVKGRKLAVWGIANTWLEFEKKYHYPIDYYIDKNSDNKNLGEIVLPSDVGEWDKLFVIVTSIYYDEIAEVLTSYGLREYKDFISCFELWNQPSQMFLAMQTAEKYDDVKCLDPFSIIKITERGDVFPCLCGDWIPKVGNILSQHINEIDKNVYMKLVKLSVINKTYCFCGRAKGMCGLFDKTLYPNGTCEVKEKRINIPKYIKRQLVLAIDSSCNLKCESCRKEYIYEEKSKDVNEVESIIQNEIMPLVQGATIG